MPLAPSTLARKARGGYSGVILVRTEALRDSLTGRGSNTIAIVRPMQLTVGTKLGYGGYHQTVTGQMPARPPISFTEQDKLEIMRTIQRYLVGQAKKDFAGIADITSKGKAHVGGI